LVLGADRDPLDNRGDGHEHVEDRDPAAERTPAYVGAITSGSHALLPAFCVLNRLDAAEVIGAVIEAVCAGPSGVRRAALSAGVPYTTARGFLRAFGRSSRRLAAAFSALAIELAVDAVSVGADQRGGALRAIRASWNAAMSLPGWAALSLWRFCSAVCGGSFLTSNTNSPYLFVGRRRFMPPVP
jgi:hypothetical protein